MDVNTSTSAASPLALASKGHHFNTMQHLLDRGARIVQGVPSPEDQAWARSALVNTCKREVEPIFTALMDQLSPETLNASYQTKLMTEAARSGSGHIMKLLLALGGDVNCPSCDWKRGSLLAVAVDNGQHVCEVLIAQGADLKGETGTVRLLWLAQLPLSSGPLASRHTRFLSCCSKTVLMSTIQMQPATLPCISVFSGPL